MEENLTKAIHDLDFTVNELQGALGKSGSVEGTVILRLLGLARELKSDVEMLLNDHQIDREANERAK
jgi:ABC-type dipeptide/oligopeptide/nickel transport system ATPase subunit